MGHKTDPSEVSKKSPRRVRIIDPLKTGDDEPAKRGELPEAEIRPAQCPSCKSTERAPFRDGAISETNVTMELDGQAFNRQRWYNTACLSCGQRYRVIRYDFEPPKKAPHQESAG